MRDFLAQCRDDRDAERVQHPQQKQTTKRARTADTHVIRGDGGADAAFRTKVNAKYRELVQSTSHALTNKQAGLLMERARREIFEESQHQPGDSSSTSRRSTRRKVTGGGMGLGYWRV